MPKRVHLGTLLVGIAARDLIGIERMLGALDADGGLGVLA
jgi:hypothetical protein